VQFRKVIHISGVLIPLLAREDILGKNQTIALIIIGLVVYLTIEVLKPKIRKDLLSLVYRENELSGFSSEPLSYILSVLWLLFLSYFIDEKFCYASIAILAAGDGFAGVIGRRYGKHRFWFNKNKSWEGSISGLFAASVSGYYYAGPIALFGSVSGMMAGAVNKNDNIAVPLSALAAMLLFQYVAGWI